MGLTREAVEYMTTPWYKIPVNLGNAGDEAYFGQGIGVIIATDAGNSSRLTYTGGLALPKDIKNMDRERRHCTVNGPDNVCVQE